MYELYSGKMLFPGHTNNDMLRLHMELKGPFSKKMLKKVEFQSYALAYVIFCDINQVEHTTLLSA